MKKYTLILLFLCSNGLLSQTAEDYFNKGKYKYKLKDFSGAILDFNKVIELEPNFYAYYNRALAKYELEDYKGAILDYDIAIKLDPNYAFVYFNR
jgi:tetratricopeptide (TPR) repeat protein